MTISILTIARTFYLIMTIKWSMYFVRTINVPGISFQIESRFSLKFSSERYLHALTHVNIVICSYLLFSHCLYYVIFSSTYHSFIEVLCAFACISHMCDFPASCIFDGRVRHTIDCSFHCYCAVQCCCYCCCFGFTSFRNNRSANKNETKQATNTYTECNK